MKRISKKNAIVYDIYETLCSKDIYEGQHSYIPVFISVFDHWLSEKESLDVTLFSEKNKELYKDKLLSFYIQLYKMYEVFTYFEMNYTGRSALEFSSEIEYLDWVRLSLDEFIFLRLLIPELQIIIDGGYDYTLPTFLTKDADRSKLETLVKKNGLYILK